MPNDEIFSTTSKGGSGEIISVRIIIEGKVQKVGLRNWIKNKAVKFKVYGWVRNRMNDTVEALFYGPEESVNEMIKLCHQGPSFAHIKRVKEFPQSDTGNAPIEFIILPTI
jgi:acylphosphatase